MRRLFASIFVAAGAAALLATGAVAQMNSGTGTGPGTTVRDIGTAAGSFDTVVSVDPTANRLVVENATGEQRTIRLDDTTGIQRRSAPGTTPTTLRIAQLTPGDRIIVSGSSRAGGFTAQRIEVLPSGPPGMTPHANPASPPGVMRPGAPNAPQPDPSPRGGIGTTPTNPSGAGTGGGMGGSGAGGGAGGGGR